MKQKVNENRLYRNVPKLKKIAALVLRLKKNILLHLQISEENYG